MEFSDNRSLSNYEDGVGSREGIPSFDERFEAMLRKLNDTVLVCCAECNIQPKDVAEYLYSMNSEYCNYLVNRYCIIGTCSEARRAVVYVKEKINSIVYNITKNQYMFSFKIMSLIDMTRDSLRECSIRKDGSKSIFSNEKKSPVYYRICEPDARAIVNDALHFIHRVGSLYDHTSKAVIPSFVNVIAMIYSRLLFYVLVPLFDIYTTRRQYKGAEKDGQKMWKYLHRFDASDVNDFFVEFNIAVVDDDDDNDLSNSEMLEKYEDPDEVEEEAEEFLNSDDSYDD